MSRFLFFCLTFYASWYSDHYSVRYWQLWNNENLCADNTPLPRRLKSHIFSLGPKNIRWVDWYYSNNLRTLYRHCAYYVLSLGRQHGSFKFVSIAKAERQLQWQFRRCYFCCEPSKCSRRRRIPLPSCKVFLRYLKFIAERETYFWQSNSQCRPASSRSRPPARNDSVRAAFFRSFRRKIHGLKIFPRQEDIARNA